MDEIVVHKFGGSCLRERGDIDRMAEIISDFEGRPLVVVSALWGMTDRLYRAAREPRYAQRLVRDLKAQHLIFSPGLDQGMFADLFERVLKGISNELVKLSSSEPSMRSENLILAAGERLSALAVAHRFRTQGIPAYPVGAEDIGLKLSGKGRAKQIDISRSDVSLKRNTLSEGIPILTGWFGEGEDGNIALLSRGGSDHSAAAFAKLMNANKLVLWKDVDGVKRINPRWGLESQSVPYLGYGEALELSLHGTPVIHPATVLPLIEDGIPLEIRNVNFPSKPVPTIVGPDVSTGEIKAIGCQPGVAVIEISGPIESNLLLRIEQSEITPWSINSTPEKSTIIMPAHEIHLIDDLIDGSIEHRSAMLSIIGPFKEISDMDYEIVSSNEYGTRIIIDTDDITETLNRLNQSLFSLQDCK